MQMGAEGERVIIGRPPFRSRLDVVWMLLRCRLDVTSLQEKSHRRAQAPRRDAAAAPSRPDARHVCWEHSSNKVTINSGSKAIIGSLLGWSFGAERLSMFSIRMTIKLSRAEGR